MLRIDPKDVLLSAEHTRHPPPQWDWGAAQVPFDVGLQKRSPWLIRGRICVNSPVSLGSSALGWPEQENMASVTLLHPWDTGKVSLAWEVTQISSGTGKSPMRKELGDFRVKSKLCSFQLRLTIAKAAKLQLLYSEVSDICVLPGLTQAGSPCPCPWVVFSCPLSLWTSSACSGACPGSLLSLPGEVPRTENSLGFISSMLPFVRWFKF